ncbi:TetR family transcriptional regulator [Pedococcus sp. 5OH_020]|uniref:TetR family transcriptional regulator n=1 Tax=Pedococcus sp. 5OH_020 TaxID=2989814 RepID=UPI0022E9F39F|nr:TetR family transcriptional regulator [Pedococcus sp. 5OH_020]
MTSTTTERLTDAAFALFDQRGFAETTVDEIAQRAGTGRTTFFRHFATKEDVIFPDHDALLAEVDEHLRASTSPSVSVAVAGAARQVLLHYLGEGSRARSRYRLTSTVPALRDREIAGQHRYERTFREYIRERMGDGPDADLLAELMASAVVTTHNHVLRCWLRGQTTTPEQDFETAMARTIQLFEGGAADSVGAAQAAEVIVVRTTGTVADILGALAPFTAA